MDGYYTQPASEDEKQQAEANDWERLMNILHDGAFDQIARKRLGDALVART